MRTTDIIIIAIIAFFTAAVITFFETRQQKLEMGQKVRLLAMRFLGLGYVMFTLTLLFKLGTISHAEIGAGYVMRANFVPFETIKLYLRAKNAAQLLGNALVFLPLPILLHFNFCKLSFRHCTLITLATAIIIEPLQLLINIIMRTSYNIIDIDDLLLNVLGAVLGIILTALIMTIEHKRKATKTE